MIVEVGSVDDPRLEPFRYVGDHRWLREHDLFVAEGRLVVERLIGARPHRIHSVLVSPAAYAALGETLRLAGCPVYLAPQHLFNDVAGFNFHRGCLALGMRSDLPRLHSLHGARLLLGLEGIGNPDNVGGLFRTAAAFGVDAVLLDEATGDPLYRKALRTSMGTVLQMPFVRVIAWPEAIAELRADGVTVVALTPDVSATALDEFATTLDPRSRVLLMVGTEGAGLSARVKEIASQRVRIPLAPGVDSLNVVVAAGIALSRTAV